MAVSPRAGRVPGQPHIQLFARNGAATIQWRMLGGNNRELGRGTGTFDDPDACRSAVRNLQSAVATLKPTVQRIAANTLIWTLTLDGVPVARSGHGYDRTIRCRQGLAHFMAQLEQCDIHTAVMLTHSRRWVGGWSNVTQAGVRS